MFCTACAKFSNPDLDFACRSAGKLTINYFLFCYHYYLLLLFDISLTLVLLVSLIHASSLRRSTKLSLYVFQFLNPPAEDSAQSLQEKNLVTPSQQSAGGTSRDEDTSQTLNSSSPYNLRASARKRTLGSDEAGTESGSLMGGKIAKQESPRNDQDNKEGQPCAFFPGSYRDLSA